MSEPASVFDVPTPALEQAIAACIEDGSPYEIVKRIHGCAAMIFVWQFEEGEPMRVWYMRPGDARPGWKPPDYLRNNGRWLLRLNGIGYSAPRLTHA